MKEILGSYLFQAGQDTGALDLSNIDPSDFETSGKVITLLVVVFMLAVAAEKWRIAEKLAGDDDVRWTGRAVAATLASLSIYVAAETFTDIPYDKISSLF